MSTYVLETGDRELARLTFQHEVWGPVTERFLDRLGLRPGSRILDLGCGPGLVLESLARRAGPTGSVVALDESPKWIERLERLGDRGELPSVPGSARIRCVRARLEELPFPPRSFDLIFARWVLSSRRGSTAWCGDWPNSCPPVGCSRWRTTSTRALHCSPKARACAPRCAPRAPGTPAAAAMRSSPLACPAGCARPGWRSSTRPPMCSAVVPTRPLFAGPALFFRTTRPPWRNRVC
ncbi:MAG: methyltransferase domain-containing protein [Planctomycetes bacterium]|nr:methyltransferase domain-containing protein [Planctomycetota bacterium]